MSVGADGCRDHGLVRGGKVAIRRYTALTLTALLLLAASSVGDESPPHLPPPSTSGDGDDFIPRLLDLGHLRSSAEGSALGWFGHDSSELAANLAGALFLINVDRRQSRPG